MKVLFIAANPNDADSLNLVREITELQSRLPVTSGQPVSFIFLPDTRVEDLPSHLSKHRPDVLHISAHGMNEQLALKNEAGSTIPLDAEALKAFMPWDCPPRLVYVSACNSLKIAKGLVDLVPMAIGSTAPVSNRAARASAVVFYEALLREATVSEAHRCSKHMLETLQLKSVTSELHCREGVDTDREVLYRVPRLIAKFEDDDPTPDGGVYYFLIGVIGCPRNTVQTAFFTDDETFPANDMSSFTTGSPVRSVVWTESGEWNAEGDFRICAAGLTGDGQTFAVCTMLCSAIEALYKSVRREEIPDDVVEALRVLRSYDGSELDAVNTRQKKKKAKRPKATSVKKKKR